MRHLSRLTATEARRRFTELERQMLDHYHVRAKARYLDLATPRMRVHVLEAGAGEPALILHGGDGEAVDWAPLMGRIQDRVHMFAVDRPGFGLSDAFDYRQVDLRKHAADFVSSVLDELGLRSATLVGGSMGGFFALSTALAHPDRVRNLILVGAPVGMTRAVSLPFRLVCGIPGASRWFMRSVASMEGQRRQYRNMFRLDPDIISPLYFQTRVAALNIPGTQETWAVLLRRLGRLRGFRPEAYLGEELSRLAMPVLVLWGQKDMAPAALGEESASRIRDCKFICMKGVAHFPFLEATDDCAKLIIEFLAERRHEMETSQVSASQEIRT